MGGGGCSSDCDSWVFDCKLRTSRHNKRVNSRNLRKEKHESKFDRRVNGWLWRWWETPTGMNVLIYNISLSLLPTVITAIATAMANTNWRLLLVSYGLYGLFVVFVFRSHKLIAMQVYGKTDLTAKPILFGVVSPALATGVVQRLLENQMVVSLFITLGLAAMIAFFSQLYLALPKEYRQRAEATPVARIENKVLNLFIGAAVLIFFLGIGTAVRIIMG